MSNHPFNISEYSVWGDNLPKMGEDATSILKREFSQPSKFDHPLTTSVLSNSRGEEDRNMDFSDYEIPKATSMDDQDVVEAPFLPESPLFRKFQSELNTPRRKVGRRTSKRGGSKHSNILPSFLDVEFGDHGNGSEKGEGGGSEDERFVKSSGGKMRRSSLSGDVVLQYDPWSPNPTHHDHGIKNTAKSTSAALHSVSNFTFDDDQFEEQNGQENNQVAEDEDLNQRLKREMKIITESSYQVGSPILKLFFFVVLQCFFYHFDGFLDLQNHQNWEINMLAFKSRKIHPPPLSPSLLLLYKQLLLYQYLLEKLHQEESCLGIIMKMNGGNGL